MKLSVLVGGGGLASLAALVAASPHNLTARADPNPAREIFVVTDVDLSDAQLSPAFGEVYAAHSFIQLGAADGNPPLRVELASPINARALAPSTLAIAVTDFSAVDKTHWGLEPRGHLDTSREIGHVADSMRLSNAAFFDPDQPGWRAAGDTRPTLDNFWVFNELHREGHIPGDPSPGQPMWTTSHGFVRALLGGANPKPGLEIPRENLRLMILGEEWARLKRAQYPQPQPLEPIAALYYDVPQRAPLGVRPRVDRRVYGLADDGDANKVVRLLQRRNILRPKPHDTEYLSTDAELTSDAWFEEMPRSPGGDSGDSSSAWHMGPGSPPLALMPPKKRWRAASGD